LQKRLAKLKTKNKKSKQKESPIQFVKDDGTTEKVTPGMKTTSTKMTAGEEEFKSAFDSQMKEAEQKAADQEDGSV
jgi:hypothetical protein